jgi:hypothetical protein
LAKSGKIGKSRIRKRKSDFFKFSIPSSVFNYLQHYEEIDAKSLIHAEISWAIDQSFLDFY